MDGAILSCKGCGMELRVCSACWRGQRYCGSICARAARKKSQNQSQKKYSKTPKGRLLHRLKQKRYRKIHHRQKNSETDHTTELKKVTVKVSHRNDECHKCGASVGRWMTETHIFSFRRKLDAHA